MNEITERVRSLKRKQTVAEEIVWDLIRRKQLGVRFQRQKPIRFRINNKLRYFIADFICFEKMLVLEIDGKIHKGQKAYDEMRDYVIKEMGYKVLRIKNEIVFQDPAITLQQIQDCLSSR